MLKLETYLPEDTNWRQNREGWWESDNYRQCTHCNKIFERWGKKSFSMCLDCNTKRVLDQKPEIKMYRRAKSRAKEKGIPFNIEKEDITIPARCPILGVPLISHKGSGAWSDSPSLDRIIPEKGYVKGNIWVISQKANQMKGSANKEELLCFANWVISHHK